MRCPFCYNPENKVVDKRTTPDESSIRRRRECLKCGKRFSTYERAELTTLYVVKKNGNREVFDRQKMMSGLFKACEKRPISTEEIEEMGNKIETELRKKDSSEIKSALIGEKIMKYLKRKDKVAYIRFASVYREFTDLDSFKEELKKLTNK
ncbi:transcriptional repressor NrdR [Candidatus Woesearchaeota archaeon]|nr:transcriptional repressor NrdR [Candidatus Woesearchaeota archaeon]